MALTAPLIKPYDFGSLKVTMTSTNPLKPGVYYLSGIQSIEGIDDFTVESVLARGTGNAIYGHTDGFVTWNDVTFTVLKSEWSRIKAIFGMYDLIEGTTLLNINIINKKKGLNVKEVEVTNLMGCKFISQTSGQTIGAEALTSTFTVRPLDVTDGNPISIAARAILSV